MPVSDIKTMHAVVSGSVAPARFNTAVIGAFAVVALALAAVGVYGLLSFSVAARTREFGVRTALGAAPREIRRLVIGDGVKVALLGLSIGDSRSDRSRPAAAITPLRGRADRRADVCGHRRAAGARGADGVFTRRRGALPRSTRWRRCGSSSL